MKFPHSLLRFIYRNIPTSSTLQISPYRKGCATSTHAEGANCNATISLFETQQALAIWLKTSYLSPYRPLRLWTQCLNASQIRRWKLHNSNTLSAQIYAVVLTKGRALVWREIENRILCGRVSQDQIAIPHDLEQQVLHIHHYARRAGYPSGRKLYQSI